MGVCFEGELVPRRLLGGFFECGWLELSFSWLDRLCLRRLQVLARCRFDDTLPLLGERALLRLLMSITCLRNFLLLARIPSIIKIRLHNLALGCLNGRFTRLDCGAAQLAYSVLMYA
jgi:hypothetical protein